MIIKVYIVIYRSDFYEVNMDLLNSKIKTLYFKYLLAALGSTLITVVYSFVDATVVGKAIGPNGSSAIAVVAPFWNIIFSLGLLLGVGTGVLISKLKGEGIDKKKQNEYFTASLIYLFILTILMYVMIFVFEKQLLVLFGAKDEEILKLAMEYLYPIRFVFPLFMVNQMLGVLLRNDDSPLLSTIGVLSGGVFNIIGDIVFAFPCKLGIFGPGLATTIGTVLTFVILMIHFFRKKNTLKIVKPTSFFKKIGEISVCGFSSFFVDLSMGIITILFNNQIMEYLDTNYLSVYSILLNITTFVQCFAYAISQASQPIISANYGAKNNKSIKETLKYCLYSVIFFSIIWLLLTTINPNMLVNIFMKPTEEILNIAPKVIRIYSITFSLLSLNIFASYYFQSILKNKISFIISTSRGLVLSGTLIMTLPLINRDLLWFALPISEIITAIFSIIVIIIFTKRLDKNKEE